MASALRSTTKWTDRPMQKRRCATVLPRSALSTDLKKRLFTEAERAGRRRKRGIENAKWKMRLVKKRRSLFI